MLQVLQYQKTGEIKVEELPEPVCPENGILVKNYYSLISAGTERASVEKAQSSLLTRIKKQPDDVKLVLDFLKKEGFKSTLRRVQSKLDSYKSLGYSTSGIVVESSVPEFLPGDRVACAGAGYALHAEYIAVPKNLAVHIPDNVSFEDAAFTTLCSIAMQGIRQTEPQLGDNVAVIGLGLIGLITVQLLKANGANVLGIDLNEDLFPLAEKLGCDRTVKSSEGTLEAARAFSNGMLCDSVIITAATQSNHPIESALAMTRKKGKIVIVGDVGMNIPRGPFYTKEIDLKISCSYGPGRYDPSYEENGNDYPYPYVRWTENRNMQSVLQLVSSGSLDLKSITTHIFSLEEATKAYDLITGKINEKYLGILLKYNEKTERLKSITLKESKPQGNISIGFIGLGTFAQNHLLPHIQRAGVHLSGVANQTPSSSKTSADKFGFDFYASDFKELINDKRTNTIFCASRHDSHFSAVMDSIKADKPIFVEKPLCVELDQLNKIIETAKDNDPRIMCGFNRRFSKSFRTIKDFYKGRNYPLTMIYRVNAGFIPLESWIQQPNQGGRIIGECCHFIDTMVYMTDSLPVKVYAECVSSNSKTLSNRDNVIITMKFGDGSVGTLIYTASGDSSLDKEYFESHSEKKSALMNNFQEVILYNNSAKKIIKMDGTKGIDNEVKEFLDCVKNGKHLPISFKEIISVTNTTFAALESLETGSAVFFEQ